MNALILRVFFYNLLIILLVFTGRCGPYFAVIVIQFNESGTCKVLFRLTCRAYCLSRFSREKNSLRNFSHENIHF